MSTRDRLAKCVTEAEALYVRQPQNEKMQDLCCIVRGYAALFDAKQPFSWRPVNQALTQMRTLAEASPRPA